MFMLCYKADEADVQSLFSLVCEAPPICPNMYDVWQVCAGTTHAQFKSSLSEFMLWDGSSKILQIIIKTVRIL